MSRTDNTTDDDTTSSDEDFELPSDEEFWFPNDHNGDEDNHDTYPRLLPPTSVQNHLYPSPPLSSATREIRLLQLHSLSDSIDGFTSATLTVYRVDNAPSYEALSYTWGDSSQNKSILVNQRRMPVTDNLAAALCQLRHEKKQRVLWIDAVCVDQASLQERSQQVSIMASIYKQASRVIIWLGDAPVDSMKTAKATDAKDRLQAFIHATEMTQPCWWDRVWTLQEVVVSSSMPLVAFSVYTLPYDELDVTPHLFKFWRTDEKPRRFREHLASIKHLQDCYSKEACSLYETLRVSRHLQATHLQDTIFGLLGIICTPLDHVITPDYNYSGVEIFTRVALALIVEANGFSPLVLRKYKENELTSRHNRPWSGLTLPLWATRVFAWLDDSPSQNMPLLRKIEKLSLPWQEPYLSDTEPKTLSCRTWYIDEITSMTPICDDTISSAPSDEPLVQQLMDQIHRFRVRGQDSVSKAPFGEEERGELQWRIGLVYISLSAKAWTQYNDRGHGPTQRDLPVAADEYLYSNSNVDDYRPKVNQHKSRIDFVIQSIDQQLGKSLKQRRVMPMDSISKRHLPQLRLESGTNFFTKLGFRGVTPHVAKTGDVVAFLDDTYGPVILNPSLAGFEVIGPTEIWPLDAVHVEDLIEKTYKLC